MKQILYDSRVQIAIGVLVICTSAIISSIQGIYGVLLPIMLLLFCIAEIFLLYVVIVIPTLELLRPQPTESDRVYSIEQLKEFELTSDIKEIWVITSNLSLAFDSEQFGLTINTNIARGVTYKFYINGDDNNIAKERAAAMIEYYRNAERGGFKVYWLPGDLPFIDQNIDYDLFLLNKMPNIKGFIGITINNKREYTLTTQDIAIKLKQYIEGLKLNSWDAPSQPL